MQYKPPNEEDIVVHLIEFFDSLNVTYNAAEWDPPNTVASDFSNQNITKLYKLLKEAGNGDAK